MANIKSQIKRNRQNDKARARNKAVTSALKTEVKKVNTALEAGDKEAAAATYVSAARELDRAVTKGVMHKNTAANRKSGLAKRVSAL